jgi:hypothetical protein
MNRLPAKQNGASAITTIIMLAVLGFAVYVGIQYVPQLIESKSIDSVLRTMEETQNSDRVTTVVDARNKVIRLLQINDMNDMTDNLTVEKGDGGITITFSYDRELSLLYKIQPMRYRKKVRLN